MSLTRYGGSGSSGTAADLQAHIDDPIDAHDASAISVAPSGNLGSTDVQAALVELQGDIDAHLADTSDAHDASAISIADAGGLITATDVEGALAELATDADAHLADTSDAHDASAISVLDTDDYLAATDVEAAIKEMIERCVMHRNKIINGDMRIDQRNAGAAKTVNSAAITYGVDRWQGYGQGADGVFTMTRSTSTPPTGFTHYLRMQTTTADASIGAAQLYLLMQKIEGQNIVDLGFGAAGAKTITISFWVRSSLTGTFGGSVGNNSNRAYPFSYTINAANTWEKKTITIAGDTTGTYNTDNSAGLALAFDLGVGSNSKGTAGAWGGTYYYGVTGGTNLIGTLNATFDLTGVQLEVGSKATPFERRDIGHEFALCQRYYETSYATGIAVGSVHTGGCLLFFDPTTGGYCPIRFLTRKRTIAPTMTIYSPATGASGKYRDNTSGADFTASTTGDGDTGSNLSISIAHGAIDEAVSFHYTADAEL